MGQPVGIPLSYVADGDHDLRKSAVSKNANVFGTESFSETLAKFRSQTHPFTCVHTMLVSLSRKLKGYILLMENHYQWIILFFHLMGDSNLFDEQELFCYHIYPLATLS